MEAALNRISKTPWTETEARNILAETFNNIGIPYHDLIDEHSDEDTAEDIDAVSSPHEYMSQNIQERNRVVQGSPSFFNTTHKPPKNTPTGDIMEQTRKAGRPPKSKTKKRLALCADSDEQISSGDEFNEIEQCKRRRVTTKDE